MNTPKRVLDLFCGAGGAAMGLHQAWPDAEIVGVDIKPQPRYPFTFVQADAMMIGFAEPFGWQLAESFNRHRILGQFDFIWSSPPCQRYTQMLNHGLTPRTNHSDLLAATRERMNGTPWVIENVAGAPLNNPAMLCGEMFNLRVTRHRFFECSFPVTVPAHPAHRGTGIRNQREGGYYFRVYGHETGKAQWGKAMGIDWMRSPELAQAIPPAYSRYIAEQYSKVAQP